MDAAIGAISKVLRHSLDTRPEEGKPPRTSFELEAFVRSSSWPLFAAAAAAAASSTFRKRRFAKFAKLRTGRI